MLYSPVGEYEDIDKNSLMTRFFACIISENTVVVTCIVD